MTRNLTLPPDKEALEREIAALFHHNDFADIARLLQRDFSSISRAFSPTDDTRHNPIFQIVIHLWAFDQLRESLGDDVLAIVTRERDKWRHRKQSGKNSASLSGNVGRQLVEAMEKEIAGGDYNEQIKEWLDVEEAAREKKEHVMELRNEFYCNGNLREFAASRAGGRGK